MATNKSDKWYIYILECADKTLYTGSTNDLDKRLEAHNSGNGAKYTKARLPVKLVYHEEFEDKKEAINKERMEIYIDDMADYAAACLELAFRTAEEAQLATLEAILAKKEYDEKYGE